MPRQPGGPAHSREPADIALAAVASAAVAGTVLVLLWPPTAVYWRAAAAVLGETATLAAVVVIAVGSGGWLARTSGFGPVPIALGTGAAYAVGMLLIELRLAPASPAHLLWYGTLAAAVLSGAILWWTVRRVAG